jgi:hypothetical protein
MKMTQRDNDSVEKHHDRMTSPQPATATTAGNPDDVRAKAADLLEKDNEAKLGEQNLDKKLDKTGG